MKRQLKSIKRKMNKKKKKRVNKIQREKNLQISK